MSQNERTDMTFDIVALLPNKKYCAIEISFQVTTNKELLNSAGHKIAYVIDGSGNFVRKSALSTISLYSDYIVTFKDEELQSLVSFLIGVEKE